MTINIDLYWLIGLVSVVLAYKPVLTGAIGTCKTIVKLYKFAQKYVDLPSEVHGLELRVDDVERVVFPDAV
jgi:hypothetical protein